jgi:hypothetical protein
MMTMKLTDWGWTRMETPEAVIYTKPGRRPIVYARREMIERAQELWVNEEPSERSAFMRKIVKVRWNRPGAREHQAEIKRAWWDRHRATTSVAAE